MRNVWLAAVVVSIGCASAPIKKQDQVALAAADALVLQGCYDCLLEARETYARVAVGRARPLVVTRLFETELLITLREKELAIDWSAAFARAQALAASLSPAIEPARYLAMVDAVSPDAEGWPRQELGAFRRERDQNNYVSRINGELEWLQTGVLAAPVRRYLSLSLDCAYFTRRGPPGQPPRPAGALEVPADAPPLLIYRAATCMRVNSRSLERVRALVPQFVETSFFLGRLAVAVAQQEGPGKGRELLTEVHARFPHSPSVTYLSARFNQLIGDCRAALRFYDETIAIKNAHEDALLGRTMCLTFLKRTDEAIAAATAIIDLRLDNVAFGYYWRAWNHHLKKDLDPARADITRAKAGRSRPDFYELAGIIEYDQRDLEPARVDLMAARDMDGERCPAMWYLGLVYMERKSFAMSAAQFEDAMRCYDGRVKFSEAALKVMQARDNLDAEFKARQIANFETAIQEDRNQYYASAFNAANHYAQAGNVDKARLLIEVAARDPSLADVVAHLRRIIGGGR